MTVILFVMIVPGLVAGYLIVLRPVLHAIPAFQKVYLRQAASGRSFGRYAAGLLPWRGRTS
jgi:hypothetical protein